MDTNKMITVKNVTNHVVGFVTDSTTGIGKIRRIFRPREEKQIPFGELQQASYTAGGPYILLNSLQIMDKEVLKELFGIVPEPEYFYSEADVKKILFTGSLDELKDMLEFGNGAVLSMVKDVAIKNKLDSLDRRQLIKDATGFDVSLYFDMHEGETPAEPEKKVRRVSQTTTEEPVVEAPQRRAAIPEPPKYEIVTE